MDRELEEELQDVELAEQTGQEQEEQHQSEHKDVQKQQEQKGVDLVEQKEEEHIKQDHDEEQQHFKQEEEQEDEQEDQWADNDVDFFRDLVSNDGNGDNEDSTTPNNGDSSSFREEGTSNGHRIEDEGPSHFTGSLQIICTRFDQQGVLLEARRAEETLSSSLHVMEGILRDAGEGELFCNDLGQSLMSALDCLAMANSRLQSVRRLLVQARIELNDKVVGN